jgi:hypothetical protein
LEEEKEGFWMPVQLFESKKSRNDLLEAQKAKL